jgi:taurine dioxygenase
MGPVLGAYIHDLQLQDMNDAQFAALRRALVEFEVLVLRDQALTVEGHMALGRRFGELTVSPFSPNADAAPELIVLDNDGQSAKPLTDIWHSDETFRAAPPLATILRARIVPRFGGDTMFASMSAAYESLSERMRVYLSGLTAVHGFGRFGELLRADPERRAILHRVENDNPMPHHPVVRVHPESGRKAIFVNPHFTTRIDDVPEDESRALLAHLFSRALVPELQLRVSWAPDTVVMWDNRSVQHYAPNDYLPQRRRMERVTIRGEVPRGDDPVQVFAPAERGFAARHTAASLGTADGATSSRRQFDR